MLIDAPAGAGASWHIRDGLIPDPIRKEFTVSNDAQVPFLTQEAYDRLVAELENLSTVGRDEIAKRIEAAREEGDLKENGGYHAAKDEQGKMEARIRTLEALLKTAKVGEAPASRGIVEPGTVVTATVAGGEEVFLLGSREIAGGHRPRRVQRGQPARIRHPGSQGRRQDLLRGAERPLDRCRDPERRDLRRLQPPGPLG